MDENGELRNSKGPLLEVRNLHMHYITDEETIKAVNGISFSIESGESLGLVGETGAGKTSAALSIMQLVPDPPGIIVDGEILFKGRNLVFNSERRSRQIRGNKISMVFQDPMTALNPIMPVGKQLTEVLMTHRKMSGGEAWETVKKMIEIVGVKSDRLKDYPHQFSGGMKQRVVVLMALLCNPELLIADEPTTALDVTIQAQVLEMIRQLREKYKMSLLLITHDLGVVAETCDRVAIMYAGEIVEMGGTADVFNLPMHPYTRGLFESIPRLDSPVDRLTPIDGQVPNPAGLPSGCFFHPRCRCRAPECDKVSPAYKAQGGHIYKCVL
ncbi:MAG: ABC transporter ATP-binding protein [Clostridiales bacterium]|nr:ABC transporter ATP-binding protein [Clostridiales bacterium]